jgi:hypothetical protein
VCWALGCMFGALCSSIALGSRRPDLALDGNSCRPSTRFGLPVLSQVCDEGLDEQEEDGFAGRTRLTECPTGVGVESLGELNDKTSFPWGHFRAAASQHATARGIRKMPGAFKTWEDVVTELLTPIPAPSAPPPTEGEGDVQPDLQAMDVEGASASNDAVGNAGGEETEERELAAACALV